MKIAHVALWVKNLELMRDFYVKFFDGVANDKYYNPTKQFESYFVSFDSGCKLELMTKPNLIENHGSNAFGWTHLAFSIGSKEAVNAKTEELRLAGYTIVGEPRTTGDGYYESVVLDPEGNQIEVTI